MSENFEQAKKICVTILSNEKGVITPAVITSAIEKVRLLYPLDGNENEILFKHLEALYAVFSDEYRILDDQEPEPWVKNKKASFKWEFWNRYRLYLEGKNFAPDTINKLDNLTDDILDRLVQPGNNERFDKRGLIVGHVQSGKTSNYTGLICKSADVGYKLIIILAGIHNSLRSQTQFRIDEGFLGFDTQTARNFAQASNRIGVGRINPNLAAHSLTTSDVNGDFNRRASEASGINIRGNDPIILVIKKNSSILKNLLLWLAGRGETMSDGKKLVKNLPLLLIDDEADNASINISSSQVSKINGGIRALLSLFEQSVYIGYTATPYANIFVKDYKEEEVKGLDLDLETAKEKIKLTIGSDIFPKDFIVNIPAPSNYVGPAKIFGIVSSEELDKEVEPISLFKIADDYQPPKPFTDDDDEWEEYNKLIENIRLENKYFITDYHRKGDVLPTELPSSLQYAIKCFFLACAGRRARGQEKEHNSMLIHVSRFNLWQDRISSLVLNIFKNYSRQIEFNQGTLLSELKLIWEKDFIPKTQELMKNKSVNDPGITELSWEDLIPHIYPAVSKIDIRAVHGDTKIEGLEHKNIRPLDYFENKESGLSVIAIGGNKLSRGLTLEGLTVSYYLRASKMYDTLMQMGRWFGYRPGYLDLCRLFTSEELVDWYRHITVATEEMRAEFDRMCDLGKKPRDYGLKVRTHPGVLSITASNKFRYKKIMELSYSGELEETYSFRKHSKKHLINYNHTVGFIKELKTPTSTINSDPSFKKHYVWRGKNNYNQIINFLSNYQSFQASFNTNLINEYILAQTKNGDLKNWTIAVINNSLASGADRINIASDIDVGLTSRANDADEGKEIYEIAKAHIIDPAHEYIDLDDSQIKNARKETVEDYKKKGKDKTDVKNPNTLRIKTNRSSENGLLLIYLLNPIPNKEKPLAVVAECPLIGLAISFPYIDNDEKVEYAVNEQFLKQFGYPDEVDEMEEEEEWGEEISETDSEIEQNILKEIENSKNFNSNINLEITEGIQGNFIDVSSSDEIIGKDNCIISNSTLNKITVPSEWKVIPFIQKHNINKFFCPKNPEFWIINPSAEVVSESKSILATNGKNESLFALSSSECVYEDDCTGIEIKNLDPYYFLAIFNSTLFQFWTKAKSESNIRMAVEKFPIKTDGENNGISLIAESIINLEQDKDGREAKIISGYFTSLLDVAIFEIYFPLDFKSNNFSVLLDLRSMEKFNPSDRKQVKAIYEKLSNNNHIVKKTLRGVMSLDKIKLMYNAIRG